MVLCALACPNRAFAQQADPTAMAQAFDGALTCAALTANKTDDAADAQAWQWVDRSFAFGMLAAKFYVDARREALSNEDLKAMRAQYATALREMTPEQREPFEQGCAEKYADVDALCAHNGCVHTPGAR